MTALEIIETKTSTPDTGLTCFVLVLRFLGLLPILNS